MDLVARCLKGRDELLVAFGDVPATVDNDEGWFGGRHGSEFFILGKDGRA